MTSISNGESGLSVRTKLNASLAVTDAFTVSSGNVGIGVTPSAWSLGKVLQIGNYPALWSDGSTSAYLSNNVYYNGAFKYLNDGYANYYIQSAVNGQHSWNIAPSGTAGNAITFTQAMTLGASGKLLLGRTTQVTSAAGVTAETEGRYLSVVAGQGAYSFGNAQGVNAFVIADASNGTTEVERMRIDASGNVGIGTTTPNAASIVDAQSTTKGVRFPNMTTSQKNAIANVAGNVVFDTTLGKLCVNTGSGWQTITSA